MSLQLDYSHSQTPFVDRPSVMSFQVHAWSNPSEVTGRGGMTSVGHLELRRGSVSYGSLHSDLDEIVEDLSRVASALLTKKNKLRAGIEVENRSGDILILDRVVLNDRWCGLGLGPLLAGLCIRRLSTGVGIVGTYPYPVGVTGAARRAEVQAKIEAAWARLGFIEFKQGVWYLDPADSTLDATIDELRHNLDRNHA